MTAAVPVIGSDILPISQVVQGLGVTYPLHDIDGLANAITHFQAMSAADRQQEGHALRQRLLEYYDLKSFRQRWRNLVESRLMPETQIP